MANWSVSHRTKETHARWNNLEQKEKEKWNRQAELINATEVKDLSDRSKKKMVESSIKRLTNEVILSRFTAPEEMYFSFFRGGGYSESQNLEP